MVLECANIKVLPGHADEFSRVIVEAVDQVIAFAQGFVSYEVHRGIEDPTHFLLTIRWESLEAHTVGFRQSPAFAQWRALVGPFFAEPPVVSHFDRLSSPPSAF